MQFRFRVCFLICEVSAVVLAALAASAAQAENPANQPAKQSPAIATGNIANGLYRNPSFNFTYKIPYGWVDRTDLMRDDSDDPANGLVLLAVFERPPEASGSTINPAVLIAAESASSYPGLKTAADYFGPLEEVTAAKGFKALNDPYVFSVGAKPLARADFSKEIGQSTAHQTSLVMLQKGYVVSFTFIGESDDEVEKLLEGLSFGVPQMASSHSSTTHPSAPKK
jgi:hypothetical protein